MELSEALAAGALGLAGGLVGGLLGVGGGILFVPALAIFAGQSQLEAASTSLLAIVAVAALGSYRQHAYGNVRLADGLALGALSLVGVGIGAVTANAVSQRTLEISFAALLLFFALQLARRALRSDDG
ncbi:MAG: TSUP family transporter [Solirubrobacterales bacterium]